MYQGMAIATAVRETNAAHLLSGCFIFGIPRRLERVGTWQELDIDDAVLDLVVAHIDLLDRRHRGFVPTHCRASVSGYPM
jgi:hypothetical protein